MPELVTLRSGLKIPKDELYENAAELYNDFKAYPDLLLRFSYVANHDFDEEVAKKHFSDDDLFKLSARFLLHVGPLEQVCSDQMMARSAIAASMIAVSECYGELEGYLQEPIEDKQLLPVLHKNSPINPMQLLDPFYSD